MNILVPDKQDTTIICALPASGTHRCGYAFICHLDAPRVGSWSLVYLLESQALYFVRKMHFLFESPTVLPIEGWILISASTQVLVTEQRYYEFYIQLPL